MIITASVSDPDQNLSGTIIFWPIGSGYYIIIITEMKTHVLGKKGRKRNRKGNRKNGKKEKKGEKRRKKEKKGGNRRKKGKEGEKKGGNGEKCKQMVKIR